MEKSAGSMRVKAVAILAFVVAHISSAQGSALSTPAAAAGPAPAANRAVIHVDTVTTGPTFDPRTALGSTIDGHMLGSTASIFTTANIAAMKSANFHPISYRLRTELGIEAWHWNPRGRWSDSVRHRGYWISDDSPGAPIGVSYGYRLPRRGNTIDQANDDGYSRLDDGSDSSFWKSNPYLDERYTHESNARHPQWIVLDLEDTSAVDAVRLEWGVPYATRYEVQYWRGEDAEDADDDGFGFWQTFPNGTVSSGAPARGGDVLLRLSAEPVRTRWIRILLRQGSGSATPGSTDVRDSLGFAMREISIGRMRADGSLQDLVHHARSAAQTHSYVSSTDPWHRLVDRDGGTEQPGIDLMFSSGITRGLPMLLPVGVLYDIPANAAALLRYVRRRGYQVPRVELGEEPDGQYVSADDFGALYLEIARALRVVDSTVTLGGPSLQSDRTTVMMTWKQGHDRRSWTAHFLSTLREHDAMDDLAFLSFEWYPFDDVCKPVPLQLAQVVPRLDSAMNQLRADGLAPNVPVVISEYGYSAFAARQEVDRAGAILNAETVAAFLGMGGSQAFYYGMEPSSLDRNANCDSWGDNTLFLANDARRIRARTATYYAARMITTLWADSTGGTHTMLHASVTGENSGDAVLPLAAYALRRPHGELSILLVNRDSSQSWNISLDTTVVEARGDFEIWRLSANEYRWHQHGARGYADPNSGPRKLAHGAGVTNLVLPPLSLTVLRGSGWRDTLRPHAGAAKSQGR